MKRQGLSLLEVILAIAILGGSLAVIGELMRLGSRSAVDARELTTAQILCETKMSELAAGLEPLDAVSYAPFDASVDTAWSYSIEAQAIDDYGLMAIRVTVSQNQQESSRPVSYSLSRWIVDPTVQAQTSSQDATQSSQSSGPSTSGA